MGIKCIKTERPSVEEEPVFLYQNMIMMKKNSDPHHQYQFLQKIGRGSFSQVFCARHQQTGNMRAIKQIERKSNKKMEKMILNEFTILRQLDHPNIMKMYEYFQDDHFIYIAAELCPGKEFFDYIVACKYLPENKARSILYDLVGAIRYMHDNCFMHRDLKPQNILFDSSNGSLKVVDLGSALQFDNSECIERKRVGTSYYIAPEVLSRNYNQKCDVWSLGVILYIMLCGEPPFKGKDDSQILQRVKNAPLEFKRTVWSSVSEEAKKLIGKMLERNIKKRLTVEQVASHPWFNLLLEERNSTITEQEHASMLSCLHNINTYKDLKHHSLQEGIITFIVNFVSNNQDSLALQQSFKTLDLNGDGVLSEEELTLGMMRFLKVNKRQGAAVAKAVFTKADVNRSGSIDYSEFVLAASNFELTISEENLDVAFAYLDSDSSGSISAQELKDKLGNNISEQTYQEMMVRFDADRNGTISRQEFMEMMRSMMHSP